jgi:hypothetical protein
MKSMHNDERSGGKSAVTFRRELGHDRSAQFIGFLEAMGEKFIWPES